MESTAIMILKGIRDITTLRLCTKVGITELRHHLLAAVSWNYPATS